jgi:hypothetical protein
MDAPVTSARATFGEYARSRDCSRPYISKLAKTLLAPAIVVDDAGRRWIDRAAADAILASRGDPGRRAGSRERKVRAERKAGELIREAQDKGEIAKRGGNGSNDHRKVEQKSNASTLADAGISRDDSSKWQRDRAPVPPATPPTPTTDVVDAAYQAQRSEGLRIDNELRRVKLERERGSLIDRSMGERLVRDLAAGFGKTIERFPDRVASQIAAQLGVDAHPCRALLVGTAKELRAEFERLARSLPERLEVTEQ